VGLTWRIGEPTGTTAPSAATSASTVPSNGEGSSTTDLAVSISTTGWFTATRSPGPINQRITSASVNPSPGSGRVNVSNDALMWFLSHQKARARRAAATTRAGFGK
jgi:hypothetical protein